ncbi:MAG: hypothetical protein ACRD3W_01030 [Terriglobales bacterium]
MKVQTLALALLMAVIFPSAQPSLAGNANSPGLDVSANWSGDSPSASARTDNSGRQIAALTPLPVTVVHAAPRVPLKGSVRQTAIDTASARWKKVTISVPATVDEAADYCVVTVNRVQKVASQKALEVTKWFAAFWKQFSGAPTMSPNQTAYQACAMPPQEPVRVANKLWYMPDGRLKTLVQR